MNWADYDDYYRSGRHLESVWLAEREIVIVLEPLIPETAGWSQGPGGIGIIEHNYAQRFANLHSN